MKFYEPYSRGPIPDPSPGIDSNDIKTVSLQCAARLNVSSALFYVVHIWILTDCG